MPHGLVLGHQDVHKAGDVGNAGFAVAVHIAALVRAVFRHQAGQHRQVGDAHLAVTVHITHDELSRLFALNEFHLEVSTGDTDFHLGHTAGHALGKWFGLNSNIHLIDNRLLVVINIFCLKRQPLGLFTVFINKLKEFGSLVRLEVIAHEFQRLIVLVGGIECHVSTLDGELVGIFIFI